MSVHTHGKRVSPMRTVAHPLDPLTPDEITAVRQVLAEHVQARVAEILPDPSAPLAGGTPQRPAMPVS